MHIAILGWGSLLWDKRPDFDAQHGEWEFDGPELKIEFSRVSKKNRAGALTLVIDPANGSTCRVAYTKSKRQDPDDVISDLQSREGTTRKNIGIHFADGSLNQCRDPNTLATITTWAKVMLFDVVVWTDLPSNFKEICKKTFCVSSAISHLQSLCVVAKSNVVEYVSRAPVFVETPLRSALQEEPWFNTLELKTFRDGLAASN